ncbi:MAG: UvrD-helicase domain-containing protein [Planctomycetota bacterium]
MSELRMTDAQRAAARDRLGDNLALRSGAGCGKTFVLARRFTELLLSRPEAQDVLGRFVALTFTDKAALEMRDRVRRFLADRAAAARGADRRRLLDWVDELTAARISTIHSFCAGVLRSRAVEARLDPDFAVCADDLLAGRLAADAADHAVLAAVEHEQADLLALLGRLRYDQVVADVEWLVNHRTQWRREDYADPAATLRRWEELLADERRRAFDALHGDTELRDRVQALTALPCDDPDDKLARIRDPAVAAMRRLLDDPDAWTPETFEPVAAACRPGNVGCSGAWDRDPKDIRQELKAAAAAFARWAHLAEGLGPPDTAAAEALTVATRLAGQAEALYAAEKRRRGMLDFTDLLAETSRLIAENEGVRRALGAGIDQLLIDECQDTDAVQLDLLLGLLSDGADPDAPPGDGRLFVVGDRKQSIYRFRGAQVEVFERLCERLGRRNQEALDLSFRAHAAGVAFVNELFAPLMGADYEPLRAHRSELPPGASVEILLARRGDGEPPTDADETAACQAAVTAERIAGLIGGGERTVWDAAAGDWRRARCGDIAVLLGRMTESGAYERELAARGVPYYVVAGTGFFRQQEVFDVLNALRAIDNPYDDVAFVGALRSALFGLDDAALMRLAEAIEPPYLPKLLAAADGGADPAPAAPGMDASAGRALRFAVDLLGRLGRAKDAMGPAAVVDALLNETGYEGALRAQFNGRRKLGNVRRLADLARAASAEGAALADFLSAMNEQTIDQSRFEQAAVAGESDDVVRLMTIHKAKGLEFPVVFLPDLNAARKPPRDRMLLRLDTGLTIKTVEPYDEDADETVPLSYRIARDREDQTARAEDIRKLYVAATRHRDHLVFVAADRRNKDGSFRGGSDTAVSRLDTALGVAAAADEGRDIPCGDGRFTAAVRTVTPSEAPRRPRDATRGQRWLAQVDGPDALAERMAAAGAAAAPAPLLGPLSPEVGQVEVAATALGDFEHCPVLYRWRHELRAPVRTAAAGAGQAAAHAGRLDAATLGTIYHKCVEALDFANPQPAAALVRRALAAQDLAELVDPDPLAAELDAMLETLRRSPLWAELTAAGDVLRELDFALAVGQATVLGQIDLLYRDAGGAWHVVDYKSDRLDGDSAAAHARRYETQMLAYASAARGFLAHGADGAPVADATLYFLRTGQTHTFDIPGDVPAPGERRIAETARRLVAARRAARFERCRSDACAVCSYRRLCGVADGGVE